MLVDAADCGFTDTTVNRTLRKLTAEGKLFRTGRGVYSVRGKQKFRDEPDENLITLAKEISGKYYSVKTCFYKGTILTPLKTLVGHLENVLFENEKQSVCLYPTLAIIV